MANFTLEIVRDIGRSLDTDHNLETFKTNHKLAAVLILVYQGCSEPEIILTRRSAFLPIHAGQISFPGGNVSTKDKSPVETALREAEEEIALIRELVEILGILDTTVIPSGFAVAPVLGVVDELPTLQPNPREVDEIFSLPLSLACDLNRYRTDFLVRDGKKRKFYVLDYEGYYIWGATAKMLRTLGQLFKD
jgi:8-oxo-dGTP pyrophosphatase MutT (NUDIX family)